MGIQFNANGLVLNNGGVPALECCCGPTTTTTTTTVVNPCAPDPEMLLTVSGVSGTVNWAGQTWNLPADSGLAKSVCPDVYEEEVIGTTAWNRWLASATAGNPDIYGSLVELQLRRYARAGNTYRGQEVRFIPGGVRSLINGGGTTTKYPWFNTPPSVTALALPTYTTDYLITDAFFGSLTAGSGTVYTWAKGAGW